MYRRKRVDPRVIGSFVVGAIILSVAGLIFFGPGGMFTETRLYVLHFTGSMKGLTVGSPVRFRGVKIGQVKDINVRVRPSDLEFHIPVIIEIDPDRIKAEGTNQDLFAAFKNTVKGKNPLAEMVAKGLRAQLQFDSFVTGRLYVNFDMYPNEPIRIPNYPSKYPALPTINSSLEELTKTLENLPIKDLVDKLLSSAAGFERLVNSPGLHKGVDRFGEMTAHMDTLLQDMDTRLAQLTVAIQQTLRTTDGTMQHLDAKLNPLSKEFTDAMQAFAAGSKEIEQAMQSVQQLTSSESPLQQQMTQTLQELQRTARSVRYLAAELERDPQILLRGRSTGE